MEINLKKGSLKVGECFLRPWKRQILQTYRHICPNFAVLLIFVIHFESKGVWSHIWRVVWGFINVCHFLVRSRRLWRMTNHWRKLYSICISLAPSNKWHRIKISYPICLLCCCFGGYFTYFPLCSQVAGHIATNLKLLSCAFHGSEKSMVNAKNLSFS